MRKTLLFSVVVSAFLSNVDITDQCALPFWWTQQYHFQPDFQRVGGIPKTTFRYRETIRQSDPNNFVRIQEYSEYTWWEHDTTKTKESELSPDEMRQQPNAVFTKGSPVIGFRPRSPFESLFPRGDHTNGMVPKGSESKPSPPTNLGVFPALDIANTMLNRKGKSNGMFPRGETPNVMVNVDSNTNGMIPKAEVPEVTVNRAGETNGMIPKVDDIDVILNREGEINGMFPERDNSNTTPIEETNGVETAAVLPEETTVRSTSTTTESSEREINENEAIAVSKVGDLDGNDLEASDASKTSSRLKVKESKESPRSTFFGSWFGKRNENETGPCRVPETDIHSLRSMIEKLFSSPREHMINPESKEKAREDIMNKFKNFGLQVWTQNFSTPMMKGVNGTEESNEGVNLIGVIPGLQRGRLDDEIVLVGAHYDTVADSNGVDDNGSGLAVMLEVARAITEARCRLNHTLMFVAFDHEENGAMGSNYFVDHYLIPEELKRARARFQGAFILDGIMNYNDIPNTQELPTDYAESLPGFQNFVNNTGNRGNFLAMISRNEMDNHLSTKLMDAWKELGEHQYKLFNLAVDMGNTIPEPSIIQKHLNFLRSDHATFWYHNSSSHFPDSLNAVLLTDTGPFRGQMKECYHSKCDDLTVITPEKLQFAKKTADALTATLVELTSATGAGNQVIPSWILYALHILILYHVSKSLRDI